MSEYVISKEDLLERLKARVAGDPSRVVESLQTELTRLKVPLDSDLAKEVLSKFATTTAADMDLPCRCRHCLWNILCGADTQESNHKRNKNNVCPFFLGSTVPRWRIAFTLYTDRYERWLLRYEGGLIERSDAYRTTVSNIRGVSLGEKDILDKKGIIAELVSLRSMQKDIAVRYYTAADALKVRKHLPDWGTTEDHTNEKEVERLAELYHSSGAYWMNIKQQPVGSIGLLSYRIRPDINETVSAYYARVASAVQRIKDRIQEQVSKGATLTTEEKLRIIINLIGHSKLLKEAYHGDVSYFVEQFWAGMTHEDVVNQYYVPMLTGGTKEATPFDVLKELKRTEEAVSE